MSDTIGASELGLQIVEVARQKKGWTRTSTPVWWEAAHTSRATLRRFWRGIAIRRDTFQDICRVVGVRDWHFITMEWALPEPLARNVEALYWWVAGRAETAERLAPGLRDRLGQFPPTPTLTAIAPRLAILYCADADSETRARQFQLGLAQAGYTAVLAGDRQQQGLTWVQRLRQELADCDGLIVLLSNAAARSEWLTEMVRQAREQQIARDGKPALLPVRLGAAASILNYDLQGYLHDLTVWTWHSDEDLPTLIRAASQQVQAPLLPAERSLSLPAPSPLADSQPSPNAAPEAPLEHPSGQVDLASRFYIPRPPHEDEAIAAVLQAGALIRIKAPRQMGKTSLMARILQRGREAGYSTVPLSFQLADSSIVRDLDRLLFWLCANIGRRLGLAQRPREIWEDIYGSADNCTIYFEDFVLPHLKQPLVLGLDEVDRVFLYPAIAADFFSLLRAWYEAGKDRPLWQQLRLVVVHSTEVYVPLDLNRSPFNVGVSVELPEFSGTQILHLARLHHLPWTLTEVQALMAMVGGHPYLVRLALYHIARGYLTLSEFLATAPTEAGLYGDHLRRHLWQLEQHPELEGAMEDVVASETPVRLQAAMDFKLHSMGLVHWAGSDVVPRCDLYRRYFRDRFGT